VKSIKITDRNGDVLVYVVHRKGGQYDSKVSRDIADKITMEVRDDNGCKVMFYPTKEGP